MLRQVRSKTPLSAKSQMRVPLLIALAWALPACTDGVPADAPAGSGGDLSSISGMGGVAATPTATGGLAGAAGTPSQGGTAGTQAAAGTGGSLAGAGGAGGGGGASAEPPVWMTWLQTPFVMDTWFWQRGDISVVDRVKLVGDSGYQGLALSIGQSEGQYVAAMQGQLDLPGIYTPIAIDSHPNSVVDLLRGSGGWVWLALTAAHDRSDPAGDTQALALLNKLADECKQAGLPGIALYPHVGNWMERVGDAVRLAKQAARPEVKVVFNQYHFMASEAGQDLEQTLQDAMPYLQVVTLNGSALTASILPLNEGEYDVAPILKELVRLKFRGSVGLQGYSIGGDIPA